MLTSFSQPQFNVTQRDKLPASIQESLISIERRRWPFHPKYHGKAEFFIQYHEGLRYTSFQILNSLRKLLDNAGEKSEIDAELKNIGALCYTLFQDAERHHVIEDHSYFPAFRRIEPKLGAGIDLLENDHKCLSSAFAELKSSLNQSLLINSNYSAVGQLYQSAVKVNNILIQHLSDEEEIIIPIFLMH